MPRWYKAHVGQIDDDLEAEEMKQEMDIAMGKIDAPVQKELPLSMRLYDPNNPMQINVLQELIAPGKQPAASVPSKPAPS